MATKKNADRTTNLDEAQSPGHKKSGKIMAVINPVLLGAIAFLGTYFLPGQNSGPDMSSYTEPTTEPELAIKEVEIVNFGDLTLSLRNNQGILKIGLALEISPNGESAYNYEERLRDAFTGYLITLSPEDFNDPAFMYNTRTQLLHRARVVMGQDAVYGVLITNIIVR